MARPLLVVATLCLIGVPGGVAWADERDRFEETMAAITRDLPGVIVTSRFRSPRDQERLRQVGYRPHPHSQHKLGLAWDHVAPESSLRILERRARAHGFVPVRMESSVTGQAYLHVQRFARSPLADADVPGLVSVAHGPEVEHGSGPVVDPAVGSTASVEDPVPHPVAVRALDFPRRLLRSPVRGRIVVLLELSEEGDVLAARIDDSDLPDFEPFVLSQIRDWKFSPPTQGGRPVRAQARLPIPIHVR